MVFLTESMFGMPSPPWVAPLDPSGAIVKLVRGVSVLLLPWPGSQATAAGASARPTPSASASAPAVPMSARRSRRGVGDVVDMDAPSPSGRWILPPFRGRMQPNGVLGAKEDPW